MKKVLLLLLSVLTAFALIGCGGNQTSSAGGQTSSDGGQGSSQGTSSVESAGGQESQYAEPVEVLEAVMKAYKEDDLFAHYGGNTEDAVMDAPGKFDISKTEELDTTLGFPAGQVDNIDGVASVVHMMNANTFTGAAYHLKDGVDMNAFADAVKENILARQWICGQPDTLLIINVDGQYVITAFGEAEIMELFKTNALSALSGAQVITEAPIAS